MNKYFSDGNEEATFTIQRTSNNTGLIKNIGRLDREQTSQHLLTIKCFKANARNNQQIRKPYNRLVNILRFHKNIFVNKLYLQDPSEIQVLVKIEDIDDNLPQFSNDNITIGVRLNVPVDTTLLKLEATDVDAHASPIHYEIVNSTFKPLIDLGELDNGTNVFRLIPDSGELRTARSLLQFVDGMFKLNISANNSEMADKKSYMNIQVFI